MVATLYYPDYPIIERSSITNGRRFLADEKYPINSEPLDDSTVYLFCVGVSSIIRRSKNDDLGDFNCGPSDNTFAPSDVSRHPTIQN
jgi:hypothetical protein